MTSSNCYSSANPFPIDLNQDDQHQLFNLKPHPLSPSSSSSHLTCPMFFNPSVQDQAPYDHQTQPHHFLQEDHQSEIYVEHEEPLESDSGLKLCIWKTQEEGEGERERNNENRHHQSDQNNSAKWMSSKMRIMRKMMSSDVSNMNSSTQKAEEQKQQLPLSSTDNSSNSSYNNNNTVRTCADCNTTKTPLWRSGPRGPKSLCNACGIRQRKARRAMAAAAAAAAGSIVPATETKPKTKNKVQHKGKRSSNGRDSAVPPLKNKKCKLISSQSQGRKKLCFEDLKIILSKHSAFPQDEKEAAILLMALSYGLVHG